MTIAIKKCNNPMVKSGIIWCKDIQNQGVIQGNPIHIEDQS